MTLATGYWNNWVLANGIRTHYSQAGTEGPAIVLLHGGGPGSSGEVGWRLALPALAEAGFRVYAPDQLSMGRTDAREHARPTLGHQSLVDHIAAFIDALCLDEVMLAGNSQGGYVAAKYTLDHPERVRRLFLIGSATICTAMGVPRPADDPKPGLKALEAYDYTYESMHRFMSSIVNDPDKIPPELVQYRHELANRPGIAESRATFDSYQKRMRATPDLLRRFQVGSALPELDVPTKFLWGNQDRFAPVQMGHDLEKLLPKVEFEYIDAGHQCQTDEPDLVNKMMIDWFGRES